MEKNELLEAADNALTWLNGVSDEDLIAALIECDDTLAYAVNPSYRGTYLTYNLQNVAAGHPVESWFSFLDMEDLVRLDLQYAANDYYYALAA